MNAIGLIFSNIHDYVIPELSRRRAIASIPFGGRYRMIDFELSNMVNSDITKVGVITNYNYQSLMDHIGTGKDWTLHAAAAVSSCSLRLSAHMTLQRARLSTPHVLSLSRAQLNLSSARVKNTL